MKGCRLLDESRVMMKNDITPCASELLHTLWIPNSSPAAAGTASMIKFDIHDDRSCDQPPEKKRRLTADQVRFLEKSFDVENKLEPHRKTQLAKELGLQPRQVAIWFQNRRARCKTKVLEKEYDSLKSCYDRLKADYDALFSHNEKLKNEVSLLSQRPENAKDASSSGRSDVLDSDSSGALEIASHHVFGSDFSVDEDVRLSFPKLEAECYDEFDLHPNSCNLGFPAQNQGTWFWQF